MSLRRIALIAFALVLALTAFGCASEPEPAEEPSATEPGRSGPAEAETTGTPSAGPRDLSYLTGTWRVTTTLVDIDNEMMRPAADQPGATWQCVVKDGSMTLLTDQHEYTGSLTPVGETGWTYDATATYTDEDGYIWVSTILVDASCPSGDLDTFEAAMTGTIDSGTEEHLYTARWTAVGVRQD